MFERGGGGAGQSREEQSKCGHLKEQLKQRTVPTLLTSQSSRPIAGALERCQLEGGISLSVKEYTGNTLPSTVRNCSGCSGETLACTEGPGVTWHDGVHRLIES